MKILRFFCVFFTLPLRKQNQIISNEKFFAALTEPVLFRKKISPFFICIFYSVHLSVLIM